MSSYDDDPTNIPKEIGILHLQKYLLTVSNLFLNEWSQSSDSACTTEWGKLFQILIDRTSE